MSLPALRIAGDWGTTHLRLFLCAADGTVIDQREGPGVRSLAQPEFASTLARDTGAWLEVHGALPVWLSGMVGSRNGWREAPYVACPATAETLAASMLRFTSEHQAIHIAAGVRCTNLYGAPDVMRGEETQIIGAMALHPELASGRHVLALPGTHMKWVIVEDGTIVQFQTSFTGELYALLSEGSTLGRAAVMPQPASPDQLDRAGFYRGLHRADEAHDAPLPHLLFEVRSRLLLGDLPAAQAQAFLSGLIVGQDVHGALRLLHARTARCERIAVIGAPLQSALYAAALSHHGIDTMLVDASRATLAGLETLAVEKLAGHA